MALAGGGARAIAPLVADLAARLNLAPGTVAAALGHLLWHGTLAFDLDAHLLIAEGAFRPDALVRLPDPALPGARAGGSRGGGA